MDLVSFLDRFPTQGACLAHLEAMRWPSGPVCPKCGVVNDALRLPKREGYWMCRACRAQFSVLHGTPMEGTHLPLRTWFGAIFLLATSSKGVSSMVISRQLGIGYKTAWFLTHRLRAMVEQDWEKLRGIVEADETYVGGKRRKGKASQRDSGNDQPKGRAAARATVAAERGGKASGTGSRSSTPTATSMRLSSVGTTGTAT